MERITSELYLKFYDRLISVALSRVDGTVDVAQSCVQDTYLALQEALTKGEHIHDYKAWLYKVLLIQIKRHYAKTQLQENHIINFDEAKVVDPGADPAKQVEKKEKITLVLREAAHLPPEDQALLVDFYVRKKKLTEIAQQVGKTDRAIWKQHQRIKERMRQVYAGMEVKK